ncbi:telomere repeat-binding factor 4-like [Argentina anserina]|uniref:telomere repeat-binding factor 4-like n=1 Tax=Argentina anserina TaxID=57926 RepID=UPI0021763A2B|nr:telomere repeat-binding factor 4-like [Potentilla anserina]
MEELDRICTRHGKEEDSKGKECFSPDAVEENSKAQERYSISIFEALSTMKDLNGSDIDAIRNFIQQRDEEPTPQNFKRLGARLKSLVSLGKLEKTRNGFKIKKHSILRTNTPSGMVTSTGKEDDVVHIIASIIADAENKSFLATVAVIEAERVSKITEETNSILLLVKEINEQCSRGEVVYLV